MDFDGRRREGSHLSREGKTNARAILEARRDASRDAPELMHGADLGEDVRESLLGGIVRDVPYEHLVRRSWSAHLDARR